MRHLVVVFLCLCVASGVRAEAPDVLFQQAMVKELGERDIEAAIELYRQVIEQSGSNDLLASKARLRMGECYERIGRTDAAKTIYQQIITSEAKTSAEIAQEAKNNLDRIRAQDEKELKAWRQSAFAVAAEPHYVWKETRAQFSIGPALAISQGDTLKRLSLAMRYRLTPDARPNAFYLEAGGTPPVWDSDVKTQTVTPDAQTTDTATLSLKYQTYLALIGELPHGRQRKVIPELGAGVALTSTEIKYTSTQTGTFTGFSFPYPYSVTYTGTATQQTLNPYLSAGLHLFPDQRVSFLVQANYIALPYSNSVNYPAQNYLNNFYTAPHTQTFSFPSSAWEISAKLQLKIGYSEIAPVNETHAASSTAFGDRRDLSSMSVAGPEARRVLPAPPASHWDLFVGSSFSWMSLRGDFDGQRVLINQNNFDVVAVPKFDSAAGVGAVAGIRRTFPANRLALAVELSYQQASMNNSLAGVSNDKKAVLHEVGVTNKLYFHSDRSFQPVLGLGIDFPWVTVPDGELVNFYTTQDATFRGVGFHAGGGLCYFIVPQVSVEGFLAYHYRNFNSINGDNLGSTSVHSGTLEPSITVRLHFGGDSGKGGPDVPKSQHRSDQLPSGLL
jgi:tetratricopeptide (TPR) repeat protein